MRFASGIVTLLLLTLLLSPSVCDADGHGHSHSGDEYQCNCLVYSEDGKCPSTEPAPKWKVAEKAMYQDKQGDPRPPTKVFEGDKGCCQFTVPKFLNNNTNTKFNDNCDKHFVCPDYKEETKSNVEKAGAQLSTKAYSCSKYLDGEKLCACSTKAEIMQAKKRAENLLLVAIATVVVILGTCCCCFCYCRRRMKRSGASKTPTGNPYLK